MSEKSKNLTHKLTAEEVRKGGKKSAESRRKKKMVRDILLDLLSQDISSMPIFKKTAEKIGIKDGKSIKELFVALSVLNEMKNAHLDSLPKIMQLIGEAEAKTEREDGGTFESPNIIVLPSAKPGDIIVEEADGESP